MRPKHRLFHQQIPQIGTVVELAPEEAKHAKVLRLQQNDTIELFDGNSHTAIAKIVAVNKHSVKVEIVSIKNIKEEYKLEITLLQGLPRSDRFDLILQKATELGVAKVLPVFTEHSQIKIDSKRAERKLQHWQRVIIEASRQCRRTKLPKLSAPQALEQALISVKDNQVKLVLSPNSQITLAQAISNYTQLNSVALLIGPEGGLSESEELKAEEKGFIRVNLGKRILRTETAPIAVIAVLQYLFGDLGR